MQKSPKRITKYSTEKLKKTRRNAGLFVLCRGDLRSSVENIKPSVFGGYLGAFPWGKVSCASATRKLQATSQADEEAKIAGTINKNL